MRNLGIAFWIVTFAAAPAVAQQQPQSWAEKMFKDGVNHDFGSVARGAQLLHRFPIKNIYAVPLTITSLQSSCGCGTATATLTTLQPNETGFIDVMMDGRKFTGLKKIKVSVSVGPQFISTADLMITANSRADIVYNPAQVTFGVVPRGQTATQTIDVEYAGTLKWAVTEVLAKDAPVTTTLKKLYEDRPGQVGYQLSVTLKADAPPGILKQEIFLKTNDPVSPLLPILIEATVQAPLSVRPDIISFGTFKVGEPTTMRVQVRGIKPFKILAVEGLDDGLSAELPETSQAVQTLVVKCVQTKAGELKKELKIKTDLQEAPLVVPVDGTVIMTKD